MKLDINTDKCVRCELCKSVCIMDNISLDGYVHEVDNGLCFECGHCMAICPTGAISLKCYKDDLDYVEKYDATKTAIASEEFIRLLRERRSMRWFTNQDIEKETFDELFTVAGYSPSSQNRHDVEFVVLNEKLDEFIDLVYDIIRIKEEEYPRIKQLGEYLADNTSHKYNPLLWTSHQVILAFSSNIHDAVISMTRIELMAQTMHLGGFYSMFIQMADEIDHERVMEFFSDINPDKHLYCAYAIGYPRKKFKKTLPPKKISVSYM